MRTTQKKGDTATAQAIATFTKMGYDVSIPLTESAAYDLIVDDGELHRVQVKFTSIKQVGLRHIHSNAQGYVVRKTNPNSYDWLYVLFESKEYLIKECLSDRNAININEKYLLLSA